MKDTVASECPGESDFVFRARVEFQGSCRQGEEEAHLGPPTSHSLAL